ncbi:hypothetical protein ASPWEDRAFT_34455 [Aspergillus wentii DTO 134E9]|uniref:Autophagy-related protein Atg28 n=1 Tax=Aspergillus wentii DTO 134E9 TaxID=1073089 RepID=A0A1L9S1F1_ASPWE|nr:uncharacterized protein ASPWEDRAFT_34455 [Aspergillus wentii DTO 134E9]KAI9931014.1 hypothetical protein MW887_010669 [Aspergillus wentii]OJJ40992.1 hypothetical protein ASPWEDRAFT_34455 [Aspergillus wentii DTO 134E9]
MSTVLPHRDKHLMPVPARASLQHHDPLLFIDRQTQHIQRTLQVLIDAQSEGLVAGLGGPRQDDSFSSGSYTPNSSEPGSSRGPSTIPVRQPVQKKIGLRSAREGIFKSIYDLLKLREEEREILTFRFDERKEALIEIDEFSSKRTGLEKSISTIHNNRESQRSHELQQEARGLEEDIRELETKLFEMKAKHQHVIYEITQIENSVESKLSSYKASLSLLDSDIRNYLQNPPFQPMSSTSADQPTFYSLNPKRRTLDMAQEHWRNEQAELQKRQREVDLEIQALEEGGGVWKQVTSEVSDFEKRLKTEMRQFIQTQSQLLKPDGPSGSKSEEDRVRGILDDLESTTHRIEDHLELAEEKNWNLLVCCIAAELEALKEARELLIGAFNVSGEDLWPDSKGKSPEKGHHDDSKADPLGVDNPEPPADLLRDADGHFHDASLRSEDEDDEPDPAWLLPES